MMFETALGPAGPRRQQPRPRRSCSRSRAPTSACSTRPTTSSSTPTTSASLAKQQWTLLGVADPRPFQDVAVFAPAEDAAPGHDPGPRHRGARQVRHPRLRLDAAHDDRARPARVRVRRPRVGPALVHRAGRARPALRWAWPLAGDTAGRVVLTDPSRQPGSIGTTWEAALRALRRKPALTRADGDVIETLDDLVAFVAAKVSENDPAYDPTWVGGVSAATCQAFVRRLWKATPRLRRLVRAGLTDIDLAAQLSVVDVHALHADAQRFVVASVLAQVWAQHEDSTAQGKTFVVLDELNKYAPRQGGSPIKSLLVDVAARGRSLGVILIGAQQNPSGVDRDITNNAVARGRRPDQGVGVVRARVPAAGHAGPGPDHRPRHDDHVPAAAAGAGADPVPVPAVRHPRRRGPRAPRRRRRGRAVCWRTCDRGRRPGPRGDRGAPVLHTSDWHLGVTVRNHSRAADHDEVLAEIVAVAAAAQPDLIVHTGDLFDGHRPAMHEFGRAIKALRALAEVAPVVVLAGNHDSAVAMEVLGIALGDEPPRRRRRRRLRPARADPATASASTPGRRTPATGAVATYADPRRRPPAPRRPAVRPRQPCAQRLRRPARGQRHLQRLAAQDHRRAVEGRVRATSTRRPTWPCSPRTSTSRTPARPRRRRSTSAATTPPTPPTSRPASATWRSATSTCPRPSPAGAGSTPARSSRSTSASAARPSGSSSPTSPRVARRAVTSVPLTGGPPAARRARRRSPSSPEPRVRRRPGPRRGHGRRRAGRRTARAPPRLDDPIVVDGTTFDTLSAAVAHVLPDATVVGVVDARNPARGDGRRARRAGRAGDAQRVVPRLAGRRRRRAAPRARAWPTPARVATPVRRAPRRGDDGGDPVLAEVLALDELPAGGRRGRSGAPARREPDAPARPDVLRPALLPRHDDHRLLAARPVRRHRRHRRRQVDDHRGAEPGPVRPQVVVRGGRTSTT